MALRIAKTLGSSVVRCVLGNGEDRKIDGGIERQIENTVKVLEIISQFGRVLPYFQDDFWKPYAKVRAPEFARPVAFAKRGRPGANEIKSSRCPATGTTHRPDDGETCGRPTRGGRVTINSSVDGLNEAKPIPHRRIARSNLS